MKGEGMDMFVLRSEKGDRPFYTLSRLKKSHKAPSSLFLYRFLMKVEEDSCARIPEYIETSAIEYVPYLFQCDT